MNRLADVHEIEQVVYRYALAIDTRDWPLLEGCFTPDATFTASVAGAYPSPAAYREKAERTLAGLDATHHVFSSVLVDFTGPDGADVRSCYQAQHARGGALLLIGGRVTDVFVRRDGRWLIARRRGTAVWSDGDPAVLGLASLPGRKGAGQISTP